MKASGLVTLADLPALAGGKKPTTTIVVARLDDRLRDPRYGKFSISQSDVDGWKRNLDETFGGRVSIDFDHSSDRGGGTRAAAWITGLHQDGKLVTADVEWTPKGAKSVRNGDWRYISPTFVNDFKDEHGDSHGRALIGAALTNRPVLRKGMPTLSLSRDAFDGVAVPRRKVKTKTMSKQPKVQVMVFDGRKLKPKMLGRKGLAKEHARILARGPLDLPRTLAGPSGSVDTVTTLAQYAPPGVQHAGTVNWDAPATGPGREPPGLDDSGRALHALIVSRAASTGKHYFHAMADVTGQPSYGALSDLPTISLEQQGLDPEQAALDGAARALAATAGISWLDACAYLMEMRDAAELDPGDGSAGVPWLDSRPLATPPRPWSEEDFQRDKRRATAAGVVFGAINGAGEDSGLRPAWQAAAELGRDIVGEEAAKQRAGAARTLQQRTEGMLGQARAREDDRRSSAINDELTRRAHKRVAAPGRPAARRLPGTF
jgi:hypothetical protein